MASLEYLDKMTVGTNYRNLLAYQSHEFNRSSSCLKLSITFRFDFLLDCCFAALCAPCTSYLLQKRAVCDDMSRHSPRMKRTKEMANSDPLPPAQHMSRIDQPVLPSVGYPSASPYGQPYGYPPTPSQGHGYPPAGYHPPAGAHPPPAGPPAGCRRESQLRIRGWDTDGLSTKVQAQDH